MSVKLRLCPELSRKFLVTTQKRSSFSAETDTGCEYGHYSPLKHVLAYTTTRRVMHIVIAQRLKIEKIALDRSDMDITLRLTISEHRFPV